DRTNVLFERAPDLLVLIAINQRADAFVGKNFRKQSLVHTPVDQVNARNAGMASRRGVDSFGKHLREKLLLLLGKEQFQVARQYLADELPLMNNAIHDCNIDQLDRFERI